MNIEELKTEAARLQREIPNSEACKAAQRAYDAAHSLSTREAAAAHSRGQRQREESRRANFMADLVLAEGFAVPDGFKLVILTTAQAQYAGNAIAVAGGWVAVSLPCSSGKYFALAPDFWKDGRSVALSSMLYQWADECRLPDEITTAEELLKNLRRA